MRLIHYKLITMNCQVLSEHQIEIGGEGDLTTYGYSVMLRKICERHNAPESNVIIANIINIKEITTNLTL